jgi:broad specificity phosphatase PhoE
MEPPHGCKRIYLVRHAESERLGSPIALDPVLTPRGEAQLDMLKTYAASMTIDAVVCSELVRARRTADVIAEAHNLVPTVDPAWNELHTVGAWREHSSQEIDDLIRARFYRPDECSRVGESLRALYRRATEAWGRLLASPARNLMVVSHNALLGTLVQALLGLREDDERASMIAYPYAAVSEFWVIDRDHDPTLPWPITIAVRIADASYLPRALVTR